MKLVGQGGEAPGKAPPGDLVVIVAVMEHPVFKRQGYDIHVEASISMTQVRDPSPLAMSICVEQILSRARKKRRVTSFWLRGPIAEVNIA